MFEQTANVSVMHHHRGRGALELRGDGRIANNIREQLLEPGIFHSPDGVLHAGIEFFDVVFGAGEEISEVVIALGSGNDLLDSEFFLAIIEFYAAANLNHIVAFEGGSEERKIVPHFSGNRAGTVGQAQLEPGFSGTNGSAYLFLADEKERRDHLSIGEINDEV